jgi:hypothetical protein
MLYIGFSNYSNKPHAKLLCKEYKHCAPIVINGDTAVIYQFVRINKIVKITVQKKDLKMLRRHGWKFIKYPIDTKCIPYCIYLTCVQFTKSVCGIKNIKIQTPLALFKYLNGK